MIAVNKAYRTRGGHTYHVTGAWTSLGRRYIRFESRCGGSRWEETWPLERFLEAVEPEPVEDERPDVLPFSLLLWKDTLHEWIARAGNQKTIEVSVRNLRDIANAIELAERGAQ